MARGIGGFAPDVGLEYIDRLDGPETNLPAQRENQLTGEQIRHWVGELFQTTTLDQTLRRFAGVRVSDPALLAPARFEGVVRGSVPVLRELAEREQDPQLTAAATLLEREMELRDLLASYRGLLLRA
ncbi:type III secretion apparatus assembly protein SctX [Imhoffiella purpurea]|uniref:Uncharacterized protein n=1 Tax=Imhoffiella purpurea TaxID=1249627 RepID=W9VHX1_9GAMM|nr:hypothetical protein [Imhoffiella purpurea]EXJ15647.1 hypothetical protein D779_1154 [Imhoffiella purpurea]